MNLIPVVLSGGTVGTGLAVLIRELLQPQPALGPALKRSAPATLTMPEPALDREEIWGRWLLARLERLPGVGSPPRTWLCSARGRASSC